MIVFQLYEPFYLPVQLKQTILSVIRYAWDIFFPVSKIINYILLQVKYLLCQVKYLL